MFYIMRLAQEVPLLKFTHCESDATGFYAIMGGNLNSDYCTASLNLIKKFSLKNSALLRLNSKQTISPF